MPAQRSDPGSGSERLTEKKPGQGMDGGRAKAICHVFEGDHVFAQEDLSNSSPNPGGEKAVLQASEKYPGASSGNCC